MSTQQQADIDGLQAQVSGATLSAETHLSEAQESTGAPADLLLVFFLSGVAALTYQVAWQRALFGIYGLDTTSVTIVVSAFMLGLGLGSLAGGRMAASTGRELFYFALLEACIGLFGFFSLDLFGLVAEVSTGASHLVTGIVVFAMVLVPTALMGASLPLLVGRVSRLNSTVGESVSTLYFVNTLGGAVGAYLCASFALGALGLLNTVRVAAALSLALALAIGIQCRMGGNEQ